MGHQPRRRCGLGLRYYWPAHHPAGMGAVHSWPALHPALPVILAAGPCTRAYGDSDSTRQSHGRTAIVGNTRGRYWAVTQAPAGIEEGGKLSATSTQTSYELARASR